MFQLPVSVTAGGPESPEGTCSQVLDFGWFVAFWESIFSILKLIKIVFLWVYYTIPIGFSLYWHFGASFFNFLNYFILLRITDEDSVPEMCSFL